MLTLQQFLLPLSFLKWTMISAPFQQHKSAVIPPGEKAGGNFK